MFGGEFSTTQWGKLEVGICTIGHTAIEYLGTLKLFTFQFTVLKFFNNRWFLISLPLSLMQKEASIKKSSIKFFERRAPLCSPLLVSVIQDRLICNTVHNMYYILCVAIPFIPKKSAKYLAHLRNSYSHSYSCYSAALYEVHSMHYVLAFNDHIGKNWISWIESVELIAFVSFLFF